MDLDDDRWQSRADELMSRARDADVDDIDQELALLPQGDLVARIGYLANALGIDPALALNVDTPLDERTD